MQMIISNGPFSPYIAHREKKPRAHTNYISSSHTLPGRNHVITHFPLSFAYDDNVLS